MSDLAQINSDAPAPSPAGPALHLVPDAATDLLPGTAMTAGDVGSGAPGADDQPMDEHITYHPITDAMIQAYAYYVFAVDGRDVAAGHCDAIAMDEAHKTHFIGLLETFAAAGEFPFDQTHGFNIALTQGFFGPYFYVNDGRLSSLGDIIGSYATSWQQLLPEWASAESAENRLLSRYSSGVFIPADQVARFMTDAHGDPALTEALGEHFPDEKLTVLWTALQTAHEQGAGLLEAAGAIVPDAVDLRASTCFSRYGNCDPASLLAFSTPAEPPVAQAPPIPELPVPRHMAEHVAPNAGERLPTTPSLTERLREKRGES